MAFDAARWVVLYGLPWALFFLAVAAAGFLAFLVTAAFSSRRVVQRRGGLFLPAPEVLTMNKRFAVLPAVAGAALLAVASASHAAIDITAATTGITDAQTAVLGVLAAMITMAAAIFGVRKVLRLLGG